MMEGGEAVEEFEVEWRGGLTVQLVGVSFGGGHYCRRDEEADSERSRGAIAEG